MRSYRPTDAQQQIPAYRRSNNIVSQSFPMLIIPCRIAKHSIASHLQPLPSRTASSRKSLCRTASYRVPTRTNVSPNQSISARNPPLTPNDHCVLLLIPPQRPYPNHNVPSVEACIASKYPAPFVTRSSLFAIVSFAFPLKILVCHPSQMVHLALTRCKIPPSSLLCRLSSLHTLILMIWHA